MAEFGIKERLVRTSVFRLAKDGWLESNQVGRRSFYSITDEGRDRFRAATHRIYGEPARDWEGKWCLLLLSSLDAAAREAVRRECGWLGFGALSANTLAHPAPDSSDLDLTLRRLNVADVVVVIDGSTVESDAGMRKLVRSAWNLDDIDTRYEQFVTMFRPMITALNEGSAVSPRTAFVTRTLLIQEYRKVLLRDPQLPAELLPSNWHGAPAYELCRNLYRALFRETDEYLGEVMETADGPLPPPGAVYLQRFGGLVAAPPAKKSA
jgi:phenylacetic acid degradation operon negative regulatory protein